MSKKIYKEDKLARESFPLAGGVTGELTLKTGDFVSAFADINCGSSALPVQISHVHNIRNSGDFSCGKDWRLNLHQRLDKAPTNAAADWIYTDASGNKHEFKEVYYYKNELGEKETVEKSTVSVDVEGRMTASVGGKTVDVFRELVLDNGLTLHTKLCEGLKGSKDLEQRAEELQQVQEQIDGLNHHITELGFQSDELEAQICPDTQELIDKIEELSEDIEFGITQLENAGLMTAQERGRYRTLLANKSRFNDRTKPYRSIPNPLTQYDGFNYITEQVTPTPEKMQSV